MFAVIRQGLKKLENNLENLKCKLLSYVPIKTIKRVTNIFSTTLGYAN